MSILLALYNVIKFTCYMIFRGPLNFNVEMLFWIFNGILFGAIKGSIFSILCDTIFCFITSGIGYWMIEYAIVAPLVSIISSFFMNLYRNNKQSIYIAVSSILIALIGALIIFFFQLFNEQFRYEGIKQSSIIPMAIYILIAFLSLSTLGYLTYALIKYHLTKDWSYIKKLYILSLIILVIVIFRWLWGPYAYLKYSQRFYSKNIDFAKQYPLSLFGIVTKTYLTIPIAFTISIPTIRIIEKYKNYEQLDNKFI